jgi:hypothetical protein
MKFVMKFVMTAASDIKCSHLGKVQVVGNAKLTVELKPVLVEAGVKAMPVVGCIPASGTACTIVNSVLPASRVEKLKINGAPVLGEPLNGKTDAGILVGLLAGQAKLSSA